MRALVLEARGLHLGYLGCYGNEWIATPNLDRLAAEGICFDQHYHHAPHFGYEPGAGMSPDVVPIERLDGFGQATLDAWTSRSDKMLWIAGPSLAPPWDLSDDMLRIYFEDDDEGEPWPDPPSGTKVLDLDDLIRLQNTYAAVVTTFDAEVGLLLDSLRECGDLDTTLICVTASAGLPLGEHGEIGLARACLHEELVHVPMIWRMPGGEEAGQRVHALTQPPDLLATLAAVAGQPTATNSHDLLPLIRDEVASVRPHACSALRLGARVEWALRTPEWALLLPIQAEPDDPLRQPLLYVKPDDRWEVNDVKQHHPELVEELERTLREHMTSK